jgi:hypothetical protein
MKNLVYRWCNVNRSHYLVYLDAYQHFGHPPKLIEKLSIFSKIKIYRLKKNLTTFFNPGSESNLEGEKVLLRGEKVTRILLSDPGFKKGR